MRIALIGATGFVGSALLKEALDRGHEITAIVRHPDKLAPRERLVAIGIDVNDTDRLAASIRGLDALISAFNPGVEESQSVRRSGARYRVDHRRCQEGRRPTRSLGGGAGGLETGSGARVVDDPDLPDWVRPGSLATIDALEQLRREPQLDWTFLSPAAEMRPGTRTGKFRLGGDRLLVDANGQSRISVEDFAMAMIDELERPAHSGRRFTVAY